MVAATGRLWSRRTSTSVRADGLCRPNLEIIEITLALSSVWLGWLLWSRTTSSRSVGLCSDSEIIETTTTSSAPDTTKWPWSKAAAAGPSDSPDLEVEVANVTLAFSRSVWAILGKVRGTTALVASGRASAR